MDVLLPEQKQLALNRHASGAMDYSAKFEWSAGALGKDILEILNVGDNAQTEIDKGKHRRPLMTEEFGE